MTKKILTTHVGSLPRNKEVTAALFNKEGIEEISLKDNLATPPKEKKISQTEFNQIVETATTEVIKKQKKVGIDIPSDGEMSKISYATYIKDRLNGFTGDSPRRVPADLNDFPEYALKIAQRGGTPTYKRPRCIGKISIKTLQPLYEDIEREKQALKKNHYTQGFMNSASPGVIALFHPSSYHKNYENYLQDLGKAMQKEYEAIIEAGLILQIDSPDLALGRHMLFADQNEKAFLKTVKLHLDVLDQSLQNIAGDKIRLHICWGNYEGPHHHDIELKKILPLILQAKPRTLLFEGANPRHAHEWVIWQDIKIPEDYFLCPGVIDSTSNFIEHPELIAQRLKNFTRLVGHERIIASTDCGFATFAGFGKVDEKIVWAKLKSLVEGTRLAN